MARFVQLRHITDGGTPLASTKQILLLPVSFMTDIQKPRDCLRMPYDNTTFLFVSATRFAPGLSILSRGREHLDSREYSGT
jgi:hypothetical protein